MELLSICELTLQIKHEQDLDFSPVVNGVDRHDVISSWAHPLRLCGDGSPFFVRRYGQATGQWELITNANPVGGMRLMNNAEYQED